MILAGASLIWNSDLDEVTCVVDLDNIKLAAKIFVSFTSAHKNYTRQLVTKKKNDKYARGSLY